jgi:hypothetical protein
MTLDDIQFSFNRAWSFTFSRKKLLLTTVIMALCGLLVIFFRGLSIHAGKWVVMSLMFLPFYLCAGVLLATGIFLIRIYHDEVKQKKVSFRQTLNKSWEVVMGASYFAIPIILIYLLLWMLLGIFFLFTEIPFIGDFFAVILILGPYLINLGSLLLGILSIGLLFFVAPVVALKGLNRRQVSDILERRFKKDLFSNIIMIVCAVLPLLAVMGLLIWASVLTETICFACAKPIYNVIQWFFIMIPFSVFLAPAIIFFFNFAAESHVLFTKRAVK